MAHPTVSFSDLVTNPDDTLARARENGPVADGDMGPIVVRHHAVKETLQDARLRPSFSRFLQQFGVTSGAFYDWMSRSPLDMEGDEHRRWRKLVERTFTPRSVERLRPFLRAEAHRLIDGFAARGQCEFVEEFARQLPSLGLCELIGVPARDRTRFATWAEAIGLGFNFVLLGSRIADVDAAITAMLAYAQELIDLRRACPEDDLMTRLAHAAKEEGLSETVVRGTIAGLVFAGHETTKNQLGWTIALLAGVPALWNEVGRDPGKARAVVEEVLRHRSAATSVGRFAMEDVEIAGHRIAAGTTIVASLWSANRDRSEFPQPGDLDPDANGIGMQLAFGHGAHHCLGAALARAELQESLIALTERLECPSLSEGATFAPPMGITGPLTLPIVVRERKGATTNDRAGESTRERR
jgi:cytochrome P450